MLLKSTAQPCWDEALLTPPAHSGFSCPLLPTRPPVLCRVSGLATVNNNCEQFVGPAVLGVCALL